MEQHIKESVEFIHSQGILSADAGIILGSGMGKIIEKMNVLKEVEYKEIPHFPIATVEFLHKGKLIYGELGNKKIIVLQGRFHLYEGYNAYEVSYPVRVLQKLNISFLVINNISGAINPLYKKGEIMLIEDHINLQGKSPLISKYKSDNQNIFVDMVCPYDKNLRNTILKIASKENIKIHQGVYAAVLGPQLETRAEYRYLKIIGADSVGMSTVPEVIVANQLNIPCVALSILSDECDPDNLQPINIQEMMSIVSKTEQHLIILIENLILKM